MATFSSVTRQNILQAIAEYDSRGESDFLGVYGFDPLADYSLLHDGRRYDPRAVLGVAHRFATGRLAAANEMSGGAHGAAGILRKRGFEVTEPPRSARTPAPARRAPVRRSATPERVEAICPTCSMTLPGTGVCDYCG
ncbi:hypothetical protein [Cellulomonas composti]|uniref:ScoMcrA-like N-terminal head domain-containing protein n=1 Tax=Cellulomonas composti TaxID=266130 RepID=A0A511J7M5_9CELL|nr:hypothetical protein [Cellulomonas composti]GEL93997.1 hypothetical protein CCO02nite_06550 [Cellulomonas composti]